jgi:hypothetical protein
MPIEIPGASPSPAPSDPPKLQVDSDWKAQAQAEKERLAKLEAEREKERGAKGEAAPEGFPPADFKSLVGVLASQAISGLGMYADEKGRAIVDLEGSRFAIDLLGVLEERTKGNLSEEEAKDLAAVLGELRARFVQLATMVAQQIKAQGAGGPSAAPGIGLGGPGPGPGRPSIIQTP